MGIDWYVVRAQPRREKWAAENVLRQQIWQAEVYVPYLTEEVYERGKFRTRMRTVCMFPGYFFVRSPKGHWRFLLGTFGVRSLVMRGYYPDTIRNSEIVKLRAREDKEGVVELPVLSPGTKVLTKEGPFAGHQGVVQGMAPHQRVKVLLDLLGRKVPTLIAMADLEKVS